MLKQINKTTLLIPFEQLYSQSTTHTGTKHRQVKPYVPADPWPTYYVTTCQYSHFTIA